MKISQNDKNKKIYLAFSLVFNVGLLFIFKYYNFFISQFYTTDYFINIIIPVGISFYTFQSMSYIIDVYFDNRKVELSFLNYALYVSFFPQLVAGPIERSSHIIPQIKKLEFLEWDNCREGFQLALFGFFKKLVIADNLGIVVDKFYSSPAAYTTMDSWLVLYAYAFQIYFDFSSYTDIARGVAKIFGIDLVENFRLPYLANSLTEFWKRWHISLTSWFRDYVYYPLCFNKKHRLNPLVATLFIFIISGLWHGGKWTFIIWGFAHGVILIIEALVLGHLSFLSRNSWRKFISVLINFHLVCILWVFFRAEDLVSVRNIFLQMFKLESFSKVTIFSLPQAYLILFIPMTEFITFKLQNNSRYFSKSPPLVRWAFYFIIVILIGIFGNLSPRPYIYFQF